MFVVMPKSISKSNANDDTIQLTSLDRLTDTNLVYVSYLLNS
jgi:hypothetical protein